MTDDPSPSLQSSADIDTTVSHSARVWDYWPGDNDNYPVDREPDAMELFCTVGRKP